MLPALLVLHRSKWLGRRRRTSTYVGAALLLAAGAPAGYLVVRWILAGLPGSWEWFGSELSAEWITYAYLEISTSVVFVICAWVLGTAADALEAASRRDALTGLYNRGHMQDTLIQELQRSRRFGVRLAFLLVDVDRLKQLNDDLGHEAGDEALRAVASALERSRRVTDVVGRWGGDEFAVIAPGATAASAMILAERIRAQLRRGETKFSRVSVSIGITDDELAGSSSAHALYASADRALYEAKARGRDRAHVADEGSAKSNAGASDREANEGEGGRWTFRPRHVDR